MDGLEFQEILKSNIENNFTLGAEYYGKIFTASVATLQNVPQKKALGSMWELMTDGDHGSSDYQEDGVLYLLSESIKEGYIDLSKCRYITSEKNIELKRSCLHPGDIVVTKTGVYFGKSAVIPESITEANTIAHVGKITLKPQYNPYYVSTFLNSKYGYYQLRRRGIKATRPEIKLVEFPDIIVPIFSSKFDENIETLIRKANQILLTSGAVLKKTESILMERISSDIENVPVNNFSIKMVSDSFGATGRLDAEYYQPKYSVYTNALHTEDTVNTLCELHDKNYAPRSNELYKYIELANVGSSDDISDIGLIKGSELPSRARRKVKAGQVIISSVEGSLQSCALITDEFDGALCSTGFYVLTSESINPETLLVLFKSEVMQALLKQRCSGTILTAIAKDELLSMPLPRIDDSIQAEIAKKVQMSFSLHHQSAQLLECATQAVEMAIEQGEDAALVWLNDKDFNEEV